MKIQVRRGTFETNSSSVHSLCICSKEEFDAWKNGELLYDPYACKNKNFIKNNFELTDAQKTEAIVAYNVASGKFWKDWDSLQENEKENWYKEFALQNGLKNEDYYTYEDYMHGDYEPYYGAYKTKSGDDIVAFGRYGYDG